MKALSCGSIVPGCTATFKGETEEDLLPQVAEHAREAHGIEQVSPELLAEVRRHITTV